MKSRAYRQYIASLPCLVCGYAPNGIDDFNHAHHLLRTGEHGMGKKSGDEWCVPLCAGHHDELHRNGNEKDFFLTYDSNFSPYLWAISIYEEWVENNGEPKVGGKRKNAGRKKGSGKWGVQTKPMRVPVKIWYEVEKFIKERMNDNT